MLSEESINLKDEIIRNNAFVMKLRDFIAIIFGVFLSAMFLGIMIVIVSMQIHHMKMVDENSVIAPNEAGFIFDVPALDYKVLSDENGIPIKWICRVDQNKWIECHPRLIFHP